MSDWKKTLIEQGGSADSDRVAVCPHCGQSFDGEVHLWEAGQEECPHCDTVFDVLPYETAPGPDSIFWCPADVTQ